MGTFKSERCSLRFCGPPQDLPVQNMQLVSSEGGSYMFWSGDVEGQEDFWCSSSGHQ